MPATLVSPRGTRCARCATLIRNNRQRCPSCDLDFNAESRSSSKIAPAVSKPQPESNGSSRQKPRAAKANAKLCPVCMNSVAEAEMGEVNGQIVCAACATTLKAKAAKAAAAKQATADSAAKEGEK